MLQLAAYYTTTAANRMRIKSLIHNRTITKSFSSYVKYIFDFTAMVQLYFIFQYFDFQYLIYNLNRWYKLAPLRIFIFIFLTNISYELFRSSNSKRDHTFLTPARKGCGGEEGGGLKSFNLPCLCRFYCF